MAMVSGDARRDDASDLIRVGRYGRSGVSYRAFSLCGLATGENRERSAGMVLQCFLRRAPVTCYFALPF